MFKTYRRKAKAAWIAGVTTLMLAAAAAVGVVPSAAQDPPAPIAAEPLTPRSVFTDAIHMKLRLKDDGGRRRSSRSTTRRARWSCGTRCSPARSSPGTATPAPCS